MAGSKCKQCGQPVSAERSNEPCPRCGSLDRETAGADHAVAVDHAEVARELARKHYEVEAGLTHVFRLHVKAEAEVARGAPSPIRLLLAVSYFREFRDIARFVQALENLPLLVLRR